jgi:histone-lysine N-methyltransferase SETD3
MLNHRKPKQTSWMYSDEKEGFIIETDEDIGRGEMVFDSYGRKCNSRFLLNYGFILDDNDANEVAITVAGNYNQEMHVIEFKE